MANKINFITGEHYNLSELFSGERSIIIPDLQRDYCWGNDNNKKNTGATGDLVTDFVEGLIEQYTQNQSETLNLGLIYGYEVPADHIQICDGQQRLTTLYLLLGMLNKATGRFRQHLISDFEFKHDDKEPYLSYAIRESSLYFLSDLVCNFFTSPTLAVDSITHASWYFTDYDFDPSIKSMLSALKHIEDLLNADGRDSGWALSFGHWLLHNVTFLYFDMGTRRNGEETFVVINTTGEPLSAAQNLKPLLIGAKINENTPNADVMWEEMETWFWKNRRGDNDTSDAGFSEFLRWVYMIEQYTRILPEKEQTKEVKHQIQLILQGQGNTMFPYKEIDIATIYRYWQSLEWLCSGQSLIKIKKEWLSPAPNRLVQGLNAINQNDCFVLLPTLKFVYTNLEALRGGDDSTGLNLKRLYEFLRNIMRIENATKAVNSLVGDAIKIVDIIKGGDLIKLLEHGGNISSQILTHEEVKKLELLKASTDRNALESLFWKSQSNDLWSGQIMPLIRFATDDDGAFSEAVFRTYERLIDDGLFKSDMEHESRAMLLRRCMIVACDVYRPARRGSYYTFAWRWDDWHRLLAREENKGNLVDFLNFILGSEAHQKADIDTALNEYISAALGKKSEFDYAEFAVDDYLLSFTKLSNACDMVYSNDDWQICAKGSTDRHTSFFSRNNAYILRSLGATSGNISPQSAKKLAENGNWRVWYWSADYTSSCVVVQGASVKIDVRYRADMGRAEFDLKCLDTHCYFAGIIESIGLFEIKKGSDDEACYAFEMRDEDFNPDTIKDKIIEIVNKIDRIPS